MISDNCKNGAGITFPLNLSCGHTTTEHCSCVPTSRGFTDKESDVSRALDQCRGQWPQILARYGVQLPPRGKHGPCPITGGKDRFRFSDKDGKGMYYCEHLEPVSGGGLRLLSLYLNKSIVDTAKELLGNTTQSAAPNRRFKSQEELDRIKELNEQLAKKSAVEQIGKAYRSPHVYFQNKGLSYEPLVNPDQMLSSAGEILPPGNFALIPAYKDGKIVNIQRISPTGEKRPIDGGIMKGVYNKLEGTTANIAIVEGFATGLTVNQLTGWTVYVAFNTNNLYSAAVQAFADHQDNQSATPKIWFFADHDKIDPKTGKRPGEDKAQEAAAKIELSRKVAAGVVLPSEIGDWDDMRQKYGVSKTKKLMKKAMGIKANDTQQPQQPEPQQPQPAEQKPKPKNANDSARDDVDMGDDNARNETRLQSPTDRVDARPAIMEQKERNPERATAEKAPTQSAQPAPAPINKLKKPTGIMDLPHGVNIDHVDVDFPPGIAGDIVDYMKRGAHRELEGGAYAAMAIQCVAMAAAGIECYMGTKTSLMTITLGLSAGGKERPQKVIKELLSANGINVYGDIRSDKDIIRAAIHDKGRCFYVKDEAHSLLASTAGERHTANIPATLMELATASIMPISKLHQEEFQNQIITMIQRKERALTAKEDIKMGFNSQMEQAKIQKAEQDIKRMQNDIEELQEMYDQIDIGIRNPSLNLAASSTPKKMASIIDEDAIESGFLGRALIFDCGSERNHRNFALWGKTTTDPKKDKATENLLIQRIGAIHQMSKDITEGQERADFDGERYQVTATDGAEALLRNIAEYYDQAEFINHDRLGALFARLTERVMSVASILAMDNVQGRDIVITEEFVLYALKVALGSIQHLYVNLKINEAVDGETIESKVSGIEDAIIKRLSVSKNDKEEGWRFKSEVKRFLKRQKYYIEIQQELSKHDQDAMENAINRLLGKKKIQLKGSKIRLATWA